MNLRLQRTVDQLRKSLPAAQAEERSRNICTFLADPELTDPGEASASVFRALTPTEVVPGIECEQERREATERVLRVWEF